MGSFMKGFSRYYGFSVNSGLEKAQLQREEIPLGLRFFGGLVGAGVLTISAF